FSVLKKFTVAAGGMISLFAEKLGIKLFASKGRVEIQAQGDAMGLEALKDITVSSHEGKVIISAKEEILLACGGGYIRIGKGQVESGAPDHIIQRGAVWQKFGGQSFNQMASQRETTDFSITPQVLWVFDDSSVNNQSGLLHNQDKSQQFLTTGSGGETAKQQQLGVEAMKFYLKEDKE
uniref:DUF2345 domain-containing protein n=1 Tax=Photorhabdus sp. CRCIA-P01 TaxID=2019570 RepID=UPI001300BBAD